ncbi:MAG: adenylyltransferase/cytidyltransferase family protein [Lachnospiraceae bacterium]|jgi:glycerol-3-phosphate cytidylyltransferase|nr:adenylyltransferase/cytidyltransferase family protein [Lachnospiraceae bacterium]
MKKYEVGYTTGVFDMFHIGHLNLLRNAKEQCEKLIVGVSTDELVKVYKNKQPIIPFNERIEIVKSIRYIDEVVSQTSMDKMEAWKRLHFDVLFHGTDWKNTNMYNRIVEEFKDINVDVVFLQHTEGVSSTLLADVLHKIQGE